MPGIENYFLSFAKEWNVHRIAYAASFGTAEPEYTKEDIKECGNLLSLFDTISVREQGALHVFNRFGWNADNIKIVLDPTLLLDRIDYESVIYPIEQDKPYLFAYVLDKTFDKDTAIQEICKSHNLIQKQ